MASFEYRYSFSVDEEIIPRYDFNDSRWRGVKFTMETRTNFIVEGRYGERIIIDSERYAINLVKDENEDYMQFFIGLRLKDYWMPDPEIHRLIDQFVFFAKQIAAGGRRGKIPAAVDLDVCTVQREGETIAATVERAMRPEFLPPVYLYPVIDRPGLPHYSDFDMADLVGNLALTRVEGVEDVEKALSVMEVCGVCGRKPMGGTQISSLQCGHAFHYHCIVPRLLDESNSCPICHHCPAFDESTSTTLDDLQGSIFWHNASGRFWPPDESDETEIVDPDFDSVDGNSDSDKSEIVDPDFDSVDENSDLDDF